VKVFASIDDALGLVGQELGAGNWKQIDQDRINEFADVTEDHQWIHVDVERAKAESPQGATIAHGFLTLSLIPALSRDNYTFANRKRALNYGSNKVRFLAPVTVGSRIRVRSTLTNATKISDDTVDITVRHDVELEGSEKPAAVAELITRVIF
jgi:acyl dehydratase